MTNDILTEFAYAMADTFHHHEVLRKGDRHDQAYAKKRLEEGVRKLEEMIPGLRAA